MEYFDTFAEALASTGFDDPHEALEAGVSICGVRVSDKAARYWVDSPALSMAEGHDRAFELKHGRPPSEAERMYMSLAGVKGDEDYVRLSPEQVA